MPQSSWSSSVGTTWSWWDPDGVRKSWMCSLPDGTIYVLGPDATSAFTAFGYLWKSTNNGASFSLANATASQDYVIANSALTAPATQPYAITLIGTDIIVIGYNITSGHVWAAQFDTDTDTWTTHSLLVATLSSTYFNYNGMYIADDGTDVYVHHNGATQKIMGTDYYRCAYAKLTVSTMTWGSNIAFALTGASNHQTPIGLAADSSGNVHAIVRIYNTTTILGSYKAVGATITGPVSLHADMSVTVEPDMWAFTQNGTDLLYVPCRDSSAASTHDLGVFVSPVGTHSWSKDLAGGWTDGLTSMFDTAQLRKGPSDTVVLFYLGHIDGLTASYRIRSRSSVGVWGSSSIVHDATYTHLDLWDGLTSQQGVAENAIGRGTYESGNHLYVNTTGAGTQNKFHQVDMQLSLDGAVAEYYHPNGLRAINPLLQGHNFTSFGLDETDTSHLVVRGWSSFAPDTTDYAFYNDYGPSWNFASEVKAFDVDAGMGAVVVQLADGSVHYGRWHFGRSTYALNGVYYFNDWSRSQARYINGPRYLFKEIVPAPATPPDVYGVSVTHHYYRSQAGYSEHIFLGWVMYQGEPIGGVQKVYAARLVYGRDDTVWGSDTAVNTWTAIDTLFAQSMMVEPDNTTEDEILVGVAWSESWASLSSDWWISSGCRALYVKKGVSETHLYRTWVRSGRVQRLWTDATSGNFTLTYPHSSFATQSSTIAYNASAATVATAIDAMSELNGASVTGSGTKSDPWIIDALVWNDNSTYTSHTYMNYLREGSTNTLNGGLYIGSPTVNEHICEVYHGSVPKLQNAGTRRPGYPASRAWWGETSTQTSNPVNVLVKQTNGKLGIMMFTPGATGSLRKLHRDLMFWYAQDVSAGNVYTDANGMVAAAWFPFSRYQSDTGVVNYPFVQVDFVVYVDEVSRDLKRVTRSRYGKEL